MFCWMRALGPPALLSALSYLVVYLRGQLIQIVAKGSLAFWLSMGSPAKFRGRKEREVECLFPQLHATLRVYRRLLVPFNPRLLTCPKTSPPALPQDSRTLPLSEPGCYQKRHCPGGPVFFKWYLYWTLIKLPNLCAFCFLLDSFMTQEERDKIWSSVTVILD